MTARVEITKDTATPGVKRAIDGLTGDAVRLMLEDIGEYLVRSTRERAEAEVDPDGNPWRPLSPRYKEYKDERRPGVPKLKFDFHMIGDQFTHQVSGNELQVGTNAIYGAVHQFGAVIRAKRAPFLVFPLKGGLVFTKSVEIPARPWLGLSAEDEREIVSIAEDHLLGLFEVRGG